MNREFRGTPYAVFPPHRSVKLVAVVDENETIAEPLLLPLLARVSCSYGQSLVLDVYRRHQMASPLHVFLADLLCGNGVEGVILLPWGIRLHEVWLKEETTKALEAITQRPVVQQSQEVGRSFAYGMASLGSWDGVRHPQEALARCIASYPGWHRQTTMFCSENRWVLLPWNTHSMHMARSLQGPVISRMLQSLAAVLLEDDAVSSSLSLRADGEITVDYLCRLLYDLVNVHTTQEAHLIATPE